ncbi:MAG: hypothetical protein KC800_20755 [Candidatus Eremiobacteraeota bacterium]|nr:hypothetical protein [Candidatus Eremiobacteraeota bacterium]
MKRLITYLALVAFFVSGCGNSDNFVFTNTNVNDPRAGVPAQLAFVTSPAQTVDTDFSTPPVVEVQDVFGNRVAGATNEITVSLVNPGTAVLNGQTTRNAVDGAATFTGLSVSEPGTYTLQCASPGLEGDQSTSFTVDPQPVTLYGVGGGSDSTAPSRLFQLDPSNGAILGYSDLIGDGTQIGRISDIVCLPDGTILGSANDLNNNGESLLVQIDPTNPTNGSVVIGSITVNAGVERISDLAYDETNDILYGVENSNGESIVIINTTTGAATELPNGHGLDDQPASLAFDNVNGILYLSSSNDELATVNTTTGVATPIAAESSDIIGMDFHPFTNELFASEKDGRLGEGGLEHFGILSTTNGQMNEIGFVWEDIIGIAFCEGNATQLSYPRESSYTISSITEQLIDVTGGTALNFGDDDSSTQNIGFDFNFNGTDFSQVTISSNGAVTFGASGSIDCCVDRLPYTIEYPDNTLFTYWTDLDPNQAGDVYVDTLGTAPNRQFVVQWNATHIDDGTNLFNIALILNENDDSFEYHYDVVNGSDPHLNNGWPAVVGLQISQTVVDVLSAFAPNIQNGTAFRFTP